MTRLIDESFECVKGECVISETIGVSVIYVQVITKCYSLGDSEDVTKFGLEL